MKLVYANVRAILERNRMKTPRVVSTLNGAVIKNRKGWTQIITRDRIIEKNSLTKYFVEIALAYKKKIYVGTGFSIFIYHHQH